jgi:isomaltose glucohydrolase
MVSTTERQRLVALAHRSVDVILAHQAPSGAYLAAPDFPVYRFGWLRDGAFIADAMSRIGRHDSTNAFLGWCRTVIEERADSIDRLVARSKAGDHIGSDEYLHTRFTVDGVESTDAWWNHQLDGYGAWLWVLDAHRARGGLDGLARDFTPAVTSTARYLAATWERPCYDAWEENGDEIHTSTLAAVASGLRVAAAWPGVPQTVAEDARLAIARIERRVRSDGVRDGHLVKWLGGEVVDANLLFCALPYRLLEPDDPLMAATVHALSTAGLVHGGVHRHAEDVFFGGGEWVLLAALLGSYFVAIGERSAAERQLEWVVAQADEHGNLPEQISSHLLHPASLAEWQTRWGPVARPLLWSHAMFLGLLLDLHPDLGPSPRAP